MKTKITCILSICLVSILIAGCGKAKDARVIASVDKKYTITVDEFNDRLANLPERYQEVVNKNKKEFLNELITDKLLYAEALRKKLDRDEEVLKLFDEAKRKIIVSRLLNDEIDGNITVTEEDITAYYTANKDSFVTPEVLRASHILVESENEARDVRNELLKGENFEDLAAKKSIDPTAKLGGDIGYFTAGQLMPEIENTCLKLEPGEISDVVKTKFGYHVIKLTERREPRTRELAEVHDAIAQSIQRGKKQNMFNEYVGKLKGKSKIIINDNLIESISENKTQDNSK